MKAQEDCEPTISVALSGGGHRASLFALGALMYLADAGKNRHVTSIASVSGGSITNAYVAQNMDYREVSGPDFERLVTPLARRLANDGTLLGRMPSAKRFLLIAAVLIATAAVWFIPGTSRAARLGYFAAAGLIWSIGFIRPVFGTPKAKLYGIYLTTTLLPALVAFWVLPLPLPRWAEGSFLRFVLALAALLAWASLVAGRRGRICEGAYRDALFNQAGRPTLLREIKRDLDHVLCATELQGARQMYFAPRFVFGSRFGRGEPADLSLATAVGASACLPGAFPPRWLPTAPYFGRRARRGIWRREGPRYMVLVDGGVYDNMADQWAQSLTAKKSPLAALALHGVPQHLIVVNASAGWRFKGMKRVWIPAVGELLALLRDKSVMYDQTTALRRQGLVGRFSAALIARSGRQARSQAEDQPSVATDLLGALVHIPQRPYDVAKGFARGRGEARIRAEAVLGVIGDARGWKEIARTTTDVPTTLAALGTRRSSLLLYHGYVLAMANLHVILDYPLLPVSPLKRFETMVADA